MANLNNPLYLIPTIKIAGHTVRGGTLTLGKKGTPMSPDQNVYSLAFDPEASGSGSIDIPTKFQINEVDVTSLPLFATETADGSSYLVYRGADLLSMFVAAIGRPPIQGETIRLTVPRQVALVGGFLDENHKSGLFIPNIDSSIKIKIVSAGLILGLGGAAMQGNSAAESAALGVGHPAIKNASSIKVDVINYGGVSVGGSAGAMVKSSGQWTGTWYYLGGSGAPYGPYTQQGIGGGQSNSQATFSTGGGFSAYGSNGGGLGGGWGVLGGAGYVCCGNTLIQAPRGYAVQGDVTVRSYNGGWKRGLEGDIVSPPGIFPPAEAVPPPTNLNNATLRKGEVNFTNMLKGGVEQ